MSDFSSTAMQELDFNGSAGRVFVRHWPAIDKACASLIICHGFNAHSGHYARAAEVFAQRGFAVTAPDLRGRGRSEGDRLYVDTFEDYVSDLSQTVDLARSLAPDLPVFLLGHSAGGAIALSYALDQQERVDGFISESLAYRVFATDLALALFKGASHIVPHARVLRLKMADFSRDPVGSSDKTLKLYEGHYHDLLNDLDRDRVTNDIGNWIQRRAVALAT